MEKESPKVLVDFTSLKGGRLEALKMALKEELDWGILNNGAVVLSEGDRSVQVFRSSLGVRDDLPWVFTVWKEGETSEIKDSHLFDGESVKDFLTKETEEPKAQ